ncbi:Nucleoside diphosphate kinase [Cyphomyrmex costatus]|uniref:Nucleoside diphosphate kinase n=1 Tax=Cyphomyrmex costatus TaxID=456900 RepID=A0A195C044_9HYME|nr:Nucleoside diphosphate kinase [Cyphomyrmex costatus]
MFLCSVSILILVIYKLIMTENKERTFLMVKPDGVQRGLVGKIIQRFEEKGFKLVAMKMLWVSDVSHISLNCTPYFYVIVWEGLNVVKTGRVMLGETNPKDSAPGTIRGDFCIQVGRNIIHGSDSVESAKKEIDLWFGEKEVIDWTHASEKWIYE